MLMNSNKFKRNHMNSYEIRCEGRKARPVPMCAHAYSLTRRGAFKLDRYYVPCGEAVDEQVSLSLV